MNAMNSIELSPQSLQTAVQFGAKVLAARMGVLGYEPALSAVCQMTGARAALLVRQGDGRRPVILGSVGSRDNDDVLRAALARPAVSNAAIWSAPIEGGRIWCQPLGPVGNHVYVLVLVTDGLTNADQLDVLGGAARDAWQLGGVQDRKMSGTVANNPREDILGPDNPYGLTQAERGVCAQLREGARPKRIAQDSGKSIATIRTHLARIYSKTDCAGMVEVLHLLGPATGTIEGADHAT